MAGFDNDVVYAANVDFRGVRPVVGQVTADGQLLIGSTAAPFIKVGTLTSTGGSLVPNVGSGTLNIENQRFLTAYVVDPSAVLGKQGTYSTIQAAITAAAGAGGGNVFIRAGTYTENLTFSASVNLYGFKDGTFAGNAFDLVTVLGSHTTAYNGTCEVQNIAFQDNGLDPIFGVSDAVNSPVLNFKNCNFISAPGRCITIGQNGSVTVDSCVMTANSYCIQGTSTGVGIVKNSTLSGSIVAGIDAGGSSTWTLENSLISATTEGLLISSATASGTSRNCTFAGGDSVNFSAAGSWQSVSDIYSGAIVGAAGTLTYADIVFTGSTSIAAGITQTILNWRPYATATTVGTASFDATSFTATSGAITLNTVDVAHGGTGQVTLTDHGVLVGSGTSPVDALAVGTNGQALLGSTGADPVFATLASANGSVIYTTGAGTLDIAAKLIQTVVASDATFTNSAAQIPFDNTIPQNTEGREILTVTITPKSSTTKLIIDFYCPLVGSASDPVISFALFQDSTADALNAGSTYFAGASTDAANSFSLTHTMTSGTTSATTFKIRVGASTNDTISINGTTAIPARRFGGIATMYLQVREYTA